MKYIKSLILFVFSFLIFNTSVLAAASNFDVMINMEPDITENQVNVLVGYTGEEVMAVTQTFSYDSNKLTLVDVVALDNFTVTLGEEVTDGKWKTIPLVADSDYSFTSTNFAVITFEVNESFKTNKNADVVFYNIEAAGPNKEKYRSNGYVMTMDRQSLSEMYFMLQGIDDSTNIEFWISENWVILVLIALGIVGVVVLIVMLPTKRKREHRDANVNDQIKKENYDESSKVKIDHATIDKIGAPEKQIDMSEAIIVDENVKPFGDIIGKSDIVDNTENLGSLNLNNVQNSHVVNSISENNQVVDAFNTQPVMENAVQANLVQENSVHENIHNDGFVELLDDKNGESKVENKPNTNDELVVFQPQTFDDVSQEQDSNLNNSGNLFSILFLFILSLSVFTVGNISAEESEYRVNDLRDCIVGNIPFNESLDYSGDGKVDVLDLIYTKNLINCNFEELIQTDPGFAELHGQSNNLISSADDWVKTTKSKGNKKTTTKRNSTKKTTTKRATTHNDATTKRTTTKKSTTKKTTTAKSSTTKRTTTKKTTTAKETTTKATYTVNIIAQNAVAASSSITINSGSSGTVIVTPNTGYVFNSVDCGGTAKGSYSTASKKLTIKSVTANSTCNVVFNIKNDIKVTITTKNGKASPSSLTGAYKSSASATVTPNEGHQYSTITCSNNINATYNAATNTFSVVEFTESGSCTITFTAKAYSVKFQDSAGNTLYNTTANYGENFSGSIETTSRYSRVRCNTTSKTLSETDITPAGSSVKKYRYSFKYNITGDTVCVFS